MSLLLVSFFWFAFAPQKMSIVEMRSWNLQLWLQFNEFSNTVLGIKTTAFQATLWEIVHSRELQASRGFRNPGSLALPRRYSLGGQKAVTSVPSPKFLLILVLACLWLLESSVPNLDQSQLQRTQWLLFYVKITSVILLVLPLASFYFLHLFSFTLVLSLF